MLSRDKMKERSEKLKASVDEFINGAEKPIQKPKKEKKIACSFSLTEKEMNDFTFTITRLNMIAMNKENLNLKLNRSHFIAHFLNKCAQLDDEELWEFCSDFIQK